MVGYDSIILPGREGKITQEINLGTAHHGLVKKYVTIVSNAKNHPELRLSLACTILAEMEIYPLYLSLRPDANGVISQSLTVITRKKDLRILDFIFTEQQKPEDKGTGSWQAALPISFAATLTKIDTVLSDGYLKYRLDVSLPIKDNKVTYGSFTMKTNHPKKKEVTLNGVILEQEK